MADFKEQQKLNDDHSPRAVNITPDDDDNDNGDVSNSTDYTMDNDELHIDFDESRWLPFISCKYCSLAMATIIGAIIGGAIGVAITLTTTLSKDWEKLIAFPGNLWVRALKLLVLPLIILMMIILPSRVDKIGAIGRICLPFYLLTSTCASIQGSIWAWIIRPGEYGSDPNATKPKLPTEEVSELDAFLNVFYNAIPSNIMVAMSDLTILGIIVFFLTFGILLKQIKPIQRDTILNVSKGMLKCCMLAIIWVIRFTPIGMCSLVCVKLASTPNLPSLLEALGYYILCVVVGHSVHVFVFYPFIYWITTRSNGWKFFLQIYEAPLLAFATSSSAATLPRSIQVASKAGMREEVYQFILPLGAAINMDGTALGFPIMIGLIAQLNNITLSFGKIALVAVLSVVVSVGTAPIPNAGMVYILMLLTAAGLQHYETEAIATLFILDWFVDRVETAVNVTSDQFVAKICDEIDKNSQKKDVNVYCGCCYSKSNNNNNNNKNHNQNESMGEMPMVSVQQ